MRRRERERRVEKEEKGARGAEKERARSRERGEERASRKVGSFAAGSNDPGCIDSWGCRVVRVVDRARGTRR